MKEILKNIWSGICQICKPITSFIDRALDTPIKKYAFLAFFVLVEFLAAYVLAVINVGIWIGDNSLTAMIRACADPDSNHSFPWFWFFLLTVAIVIAAYVILKRSLTDGEERNFKLSESTIYGNAREIKRSELAKIADICSREEAMGTILGQLDLSEQKLISMKAGPTENRNMLGFGSPGRGKSFAYVNNFILQSIRRRESVITTDSKGGVRAETLEVARRHGYTVKIFNLKDPNFTDGIDFLRELRCDDIRALIFAQTVMRNTGNQSDPHIAAEEALLRAACLYQERNINIPQEEKTFYSAYAMLMNGADELDKIFRQAKYDSSLRVAYDAYMTFFSGSPNLRGNVISNLCNRLQILSSMPIRKLTSTPDIDLTLPGIKPCIYYVIMPDQHETMKFLSSLFFSFAFQDLADYADQQLDRKLPVPVNFLMDEAYSCVGYLPNLITGFSTLRSRGISLVLIMQALSQLKELYGENGTNTIINCCSTMFTFGTNDPETNEFFSWLSGESTVKVKTEQHQAWDPILRFGLRHSTGDGRRPFYNPNELRKLAARKIFLCWQGYDCLMAHTFGFNRHIEYEKGRMPLISPVINVSLSDTDARDYMRAKEEQRVMDYEAWVAAGGDPWQDYLAPIPKTRGPMTGTPLPKIVPYPQLEEEALAYSAQMKEARKQARARRMLGNIEQSPEEMPCIEIHEELQWLSVNLQDAAGAEQAEDVVESNESPVVSQETPEKPVSAAPVILGESVADIIGAPGPRKPRKRGTITSTKSISDI